MKKPDKIKRALLLHASTGVHCSDCAYFGDETEGLKCADAMCYDALEYIQTLEKEIVECELLDKMRSNREHASGWIEFWRNKHGKSTLDIPDGDEIFKDWEEAHALAESRLRRMKLFKRRDEDHLAECVQLRNKVKQLEDHIRNLTKMMPKWISVKERLPDNAQRCIVITGFQHSDVCVATYYEISSRGNPNGDWIFDDGDGWLDTVAAVYWMPLPNLPKEDCNG